MPNQPAPFITTDPAAAFKHFAGLVQSTPVSDLEPWNADAETVRVNVGRAVDAITPHLEIAADALPQLKVHELQELPSLALALTFAADSVYAPGSNNEIRERQARLRPARSQALRYLEIVAELGLVPDKRIREIRAGRGPIDDARDGVAIAAIFAEHADVLAGKHPFSDAFLKQIAEDGNWLLDNILPSGATPDKPVKSPQSLIRDQLWTEVVRRYDELYKAGVAVWGLRRVDDRIPAIQSRIPAASIPPPALPRETIDIPGPPGRPSLPPVP